VLADLGQRGFDQAGRIEVSASGDAVTRRARHRLPPRAVRFDCSARQQQEVGRLESTTQHEPLQPSCPEKAPRCWRFIS
jgi:hypothetical protein